MPKINKYIDFTINTNNTFYIVESSSKPKSHDSARATLAKIEFIVKNNLIYDPNHHDAYSSQTQPKLFELLKAQSSQIYKGYQEKQSKLHWIIRRIFSKEKQISAIHERVLYYIEPPQAWKFGCKDKDHAKAFEYMHDLLQDADKLVEQGVVPKKCLSYTFKKYLFYKTKKIDSERVLQNLNALPINEIFSLFINPKIANHPTFYTFLLSIVSEYLKTNPTEWIKTNFDNNEFSRALIIAAKANNKEAVQLMLHHGGNPNCILNDKDQSILMLAVKAGNKEVVQLLLEHGAAKPNRFINHSSALQYAYFHGHMDICQLLLQHGVNYCFNNQEANRALWSAALHNHQEKVRFLLEHGASPNCCNEINKSILMMAASFGRTEIVRLLLDYGANLNYSNRRGESALIHAVNSIGNKETVRLLLEKGADPNHRDSEGNTPLIKAVDRDYPQPINKEMVRLLLQYGANPNLINDTGTSPLKLALDAGNKEIVRLLSDHGAFSLY